MQLSKRTQYGLRAMICLADSYDRGYLQGKELATRENLPTKFLESILSALTRGKFLESRIGATGGYRLARHPSEILLTPLVARLEGNELLESETESAPNERPGEVAVRLLSSDLTDALRTVLDNTSLAQLADKVNQHSRAGQMYYI